MIVVADTSPLNYLIQVQKDELLPQIFGPVTVLHLSFKNLVTLVRQKTFVLGPTFLQTGWKSPRFMAQSSLDCIIWMLENVMRSSLR